MTGRDERERSRRRFFGRRAGHKLSPYQSRLFDSLLPELAIDPSRPATCLESLFEPAVRSVSLEIGFGAGEHLIWHAARDANTGFIGCEPYINGVAKVLAGIDRAGLRNVRLFNDDVHELLAWLPDNSVARIFILFPDPWPKKRHNKRRIISSELLDQLARASKPECELRFASDIPDYVDWTLRQFTKSGAFAWTATEPRDWRHRPVDWPETRYEKKAIKEGRTPAYLMFKRK